MDNAAYPGVVIVGAGHAGGRTAERLRRCGFQGPIDMVGIERELPYERPPLSKSVLTDPGQVSSAGLLPPTMWSELEVTFHAGAEAVRIDRANRSVELADGRSLPYGSLVLATGLSPRELPVLEPVAPRTVVLRSFEDALDLRARIGAGTSLVIVGAGLIGLEVAASATKLGAKVTVVEAADRPLGRLLPAELSHWLAGVHRAAGVDIVCGRQVVASREQGTGALLRLDDGRELEAELVLVGIGGVPNDRLARQAGLYVDNGILVNEFGQTSDPRIFAVGDVAAHENPYVGGRCRLESWRNAEDMGALVASFICGAAAPYREVPWFWTDQFELNIQVAGMPTGGILGYERGKPGDRFYLAYYVDGDFLRGAVGIACGRDIRIARETIKAGGRLDPAALAAKGILPCVAEPARQAS